MSAIYTFIVIVLGVLAVAGLFVGVTNDAVNFLNSAIGSKAAPKKVILLIASIGIIIGAVTSSGMMEVARSGMFDPSLFTFHEVMMLYLGVMFANIILLDLYNTWGLPTSTTVSLIFCLLGSAIAVSIFKIASDPNITLANLGEYINSDRALGIIAAILLSVVLAFTCGMIVMYISRLIFTFRYHKIFHNWGALWCGISLASIVYFAVFKGLKAPLAGTAFIAYVTDNMALSLLITWIACSAILWILQRLNINILKITILAGTFALALAFAGNDLVNFIGVPIAGYDSYKMALSSGDTLMLMNGLKESVPANFSILVAAGLIMVATLWLSKKSMNVSETELKLASQNEEEQRFGSSAFSRTIVRTVLGVNNWYERTIPTKMKNGIEHRFAPLTEEERGDAQYDLIRATVNLTTAAALISVATSLKLPLSTTYVTFMVAMGSSLADRAWGRESAVYRITGVMTVVAGWFVTGLGAFLIALVVGLALIYGGTVATIAISILCGYMLIHSNIKNKKVEKAPAEQLKEVKADNVLQQCIEEVCGTMERITRIYDRTLIAVFKENRKVLREMVKESNDLFYLSRERKYQVLPTLQKLQDSDIDTAHYYVQVVDYLSEATKALVHITRPCFDHIDNNHEGMTKEQIEDLMHINDEVESIYRHINQMLKNNDFKDIDQVLEQRDRLFESIAEAIKRQLKRIKNKETSTRSSMLYLNILNETKTLVLQSRNLLKSQRYFLEHQENK
ncbi:MAG: inorganic phosphate transporter [Rikenellaceae bacterium]|nr:inorganic phosphate transporter [Rikenellaceae bacterium]MBR2932417.1 inorganic phosphate transporter [Rikenellaceae bacterium]